MRVRREPEGVNALVKELFSPDYENYGSYKEKGLFEIIHEYWGFEFPVPVQTEQYATKHNGYMDTLFVGKYGERNVSPLVVDIAKKTTQWTDEGYFGVGALRAVADHVIIAYKDKWTRLLNLLDVEYDPIHNYLDEWQDSSNGMESSERDLSSTRTDTLNTTETTNSTRTDNLLRTNTINESEATSGSQNDAIYGFNSSQSSPSDTSATTGSKTNTGTDTEANTGTQGVTQTVADTGGNTRTLTEDDDVLRSDNRTRQGSHSGNIGNITTQKMMKEEIELWRWKIIDEILADAANIVTLPIYLREWDELERKH